ncbi:hypothetical protein ACIQM4_01070 [Streptomyces sp. NPDC091272]|uniref:hypothetical protein n=1 Tax=Streptomyces sp. NPDC091272 TaxID=3365981 RepID=UPI00382C90C1
MYGTTGAAGPGGPGGPGTEPAAVNRIVVFGDACGSGSMGLETKKRMRAAMYAAFGEAFAVVGVPPDRLHQEDRGDGILAALPPDMPPALMAGRWLSNLYESLREYNHGRSERLRMRVGMHAGPVLDDGRGLVGRAVDLACRLCDSDTAKRVMEAAPDAGLMLVVSDWFYENVVLDGGRYIEPQQYLSGRVRAKETDETAWFHVPGLATPPLAAVSAPRGPTAAKQAAALGRDGGPWEGAGSPSRRVSGAGAGPAAQEFHVGGDNLSVTGSTIHGGFTGFRKEERRERAPEQPERAAEQPSRAPEQPARAPVQRGRAPEQRPERDLEETWPADDTSRSGT